jgi:hypothetical protein
MLRFLPLSLVLLSTACWVEDRGFCHEQPSEYAEDTYDQTCEGVTRTWTEKGCNFDEDWDSHGDCVKDCPSPATCKLTRSRLVGGSCSATICGH